MYQTFTLTLTAVIGSYGKCVYLSLEKVNIHNPKSLKDKGNNGVLIPLKNCIALHQCLPYPHFSVVSPTAWAVVNWKGNRIMVEIKTENSADKHLFRCCFSS